MSRSSVSRSPLTPTKRVHAPETTTATLRPWSGRMSRNVTPSARRAGLDLITSLAELEGRTCVTYDRVSSDEQGDKNGLPSQVRTNNRAIKKYGLVASGLEFHDKHSAWKRSEKRPGFLDMIQKTAQAGHPVLVVPYFSRFSRNVELAIQARRILHESGIVILFADEEFLSSDEASWARFLDEAVTAEKYSIGISRNVRGAFETKFEEYNDPAGTASFGFRRSPQPEARLEPDPETLPIAVAIFERYAKGDISEKQLGLLFGRAKAHIQSILRNQVYRGFVSRSAENKNPLVTEAAWRRKHGVVDPPVSDELWARVVEVRGRRAKNAGRRPPHHFYLLAKLLWCECGRPVTCDSKVQRSGAVVLRYQHLDCGLWSRTSCNVSMLDEQIVAQLRQTRMPKEVRDEVRAISTRPQAADTTVRRRLLGAERRVLATKWAEGLVRDDVAGAERARLGRELAELEAQVVASRPAVDPSSLSRWLLDMARTIRWAGQEEFRALVRATYARIVVNADQIVSVELTPEAVLHGLLAVMPPTVVMARPAGLEPTTSRSATWRSIR